MAERGPIRFDCQSPVHAVEILPYGPDGPAPGTEPARLFFSTEGFEQEETEITESRQNGIGPGLFARRFSAPPNSVLCYLCCLL